MMAGMPDVFGELVNEVRRGGRAALCVVVGTKGSTPQERGAKMVVAETGRTVGTLGGGCVEAEVRRVTLELIARGESQLMKFSLDHDYGWDDGLICGGVMEILVTVVITAEQAAVFEPIALAVAEQRAAKLVLPIPGSESTYAEELGPAPVLVIAGAGHVGQALGAAAGAMGFAVDVIDDREDVASPDRFPGGAAADRGGDRTGVAGLSDRRKYLRRHRDPRASARRARAGGGDRFAGEVHRAHRQ